MAIEVVAWSPRWAEQFARVAGELRAALVRAEVPGDVEHVGSTSIPHLVAKPVIDIDVIVGAEHVPAAIRALSAIGYRHRGDLGVTGREAFFAPEEEPRRHVYVCRRDSLAVRNHLAVRDVLRTRPDLRQEYAAVKLALAAAPGIDMDAYIAGKSAALQEVLAAGGLGPAELAEIRAVNDAG